MPIPAGKSLGDKDSVGKLFSPQQKSQSLKIPQSLDNLQKDQGNGS